MALVGTLFGTRIHNAVRFRSGVIRDHHIRRHSNLFLALGFSGSIFRFQSFRTIRFARIQTRTISLTKRKHCINAFRHTSFQQRHKPAESRVIQPAAISIFTGKFLMEFSQFGTNNAANNSGRNAKHGPTKKSTRSHVENYAVNKAS